LEKKNKADTTICAPATHGQGAIAIIRVSGPEAIALTEVLFRPSQEGKSLSKEQGHTIHHGTICDGERVIDEVLVSIFRAPRSYTGEDVIEISCHGSSYIQQKILELFIALGARAAKPGEFTQRAFLNGKLDLAQAEAVADLVAAETEGAHRVALQQLRGGFSDRLKTLRDQLLHFISLIELELDFSEEDVEFADRGHLRKLVQEIAELIQELVTSFQLGNVLKKGIPVAIIGRPNVGKSTLLNALLREERAIVSEIEGTTRDSIEDSINLEGIQFRFIDTAGIRETADTIENLGIRRTYQKIEQASIVLLLIEANDPLRKIEESIQAIRQQIQGSAKNLLVVLNKSDRVSGQELKDLQREIALEDGEHLIALSAETGQHMDDLIRLLLDTVSLGSLKHQDVLISNVRHYHALNSALESLNRVSEGLNTQLPTDLLAQDIRETLHYLGEITGEVTTDEILGNIFKNFCIGK